MFDDSSQNGVEENQRILMFDNILKPIKDVNIGDIIWSIDDNDHLTHSQIIDKQYCESSNVFNINGLLLTKNQQLMCSNNHSHRKFRKYKDLKRKDANYLASIWRNDCIRTNPNKQKFVCGYLRGFVDGDGSIYDRGIHVYQKNRDVLDEFWKLYNEYINSTKVSTIWNENKQIFHANGGYSKTFLEKTQFDEDPEYCKGYLHGMIIADGCAPYNKCNHHFSIIITQSLSANKNKCEKIEKCLDILDIKYVSWEKKCGGFLKEGSLMKNYQISYPERLCWVYGGEKTVEILNRINEHCDVKYLPRIKVEKISESIGEMSTCSILTSSGTYICENYILHC